jgi:hypothetical protein
LIEINSIVAIEELQMPFDDEDDGLDWAINVLHRWHLDLCVPLGGHGTKFLLHEHVF